MLALVPTLAGLITGGALTARADVGPPAPIAAQQSPPTTAGLLDDLLGRLLPTTTTVPAPPSTEAPPPPPEDHAPSPPTAGEPSSGSGTTARTVPADAQRVVNSVVRTGSNNSLALLEALRPLTDQGLTDEEAAIVGMGQFPIAGEVYWTDDWLMPRFTPQFHLHMGTDLFAARGTPVRAPVAGRVEFASEGAGGLAAYVTTSDGTYYYLAHLDRFPKDVRSGQHVEQGQVVGFVGSTGNADDSAPHVHIQIHPRGGAAVNPKPIVDRWLAEAIAGAPAVLASYRVGLPRPLTAAGVLRRMGSGSLGGPTSSDGPQLWARSVRRENGSVRLTAAAATQSSPPMATAEDMRAIDLVRARQVTHELLSPITPRVLAAPTRPLISP
ncbi:MAG: M23 family metallopeptidase [Actinomycetota bacterium]